MKDNDFSEEAQKETRNKTRNGESQLSVEPARRKAQLQNAIAERIGRSKNAIRAKKERINNIKEERHNEEQTRAERLDEIKKYYEKNCVGRFRNGFIAESEIDLFLDGGEKISRKI